MRNKKYLKKTPIYKIVVKSSRFVRELKIVKLSRFVSKLILNRILFFKPLTNGITDKKYCKEDIVISLTSYGERINSVHKTIYTLMNQSYKANKIVLWLAYEDYNKIKKRTPGLLLCENKGLTILPCKDIKSYKKFIYAFQRFPNSLIVTADDDLLYPVNWLKKLIDGYLKTPDLIICNMVRKIIINENGSFEFGYNDELISNSISYLNRPLTGGGALFSPGKFCKEIFNEKIFLEAAPTQDDIWIWAMSVKSGLRIRMVSKCNPELIYVPGSQEGECLWKLNGNGISEKVLNDLIYRYPEIKEKLINSGDQL